MSADMYTHHSREQLLARIEQLEYDCIRQSDRADAYAKIIRAVDGLITDAHAQSRELDHGTYKQVPLIHESLQSIIARQDARVAIANRLVAGIEKVLA